MLGPILQCRALLGMATVGRGQKYFIEASWILLCQVPQKAGMTVVWTDVGAGPDHYHIWVFPKLVPFSIVSSRSRKQNWKLREIHLDPEKFP